MPVRLGNSATVNQGALQAGGIAAGLQASLQTAKTLGDLAEGEQRRAFYKERREREGVLFAQDQAQAEATGAYRIGEATRAGLPDHVSSLIGEMDPRVADFAIREAKNDRAKQDAIGSQIAMLDNTLSEMEAMGIGGFGLEVPEGDLEGEAAAGQPSQSMLEFRALMKANPEAALDLAEASGLFAQLRQGKQDLYRTVEVRAFLGETARVASAEFVSTPGNTDLNEAEVNTVVDDVARQLASDGIFDPTLLRKYASNELGRLQDEKAHQRFVSSRKSDSDRMGVILDMYKALGEDAPQEIRDGLGAVLAQYMLGDRGGGQPESGQTAAGRPPSGQGRAVAPQRVSETSTGRGGQRTPAAEEGPQSPDQAVRQVRQASDGVKPLQHNQAKQIQDRELPLVVRDWMRGDLDQGTLANRIDALVENIGNSEQGLDKKAMKIAMAEAIEQLPQSERKGRRAKADKVEDATKPIGSPEFPIHTSGFGVPDSPRGQRAAEGPTGFVNPQGPEGSAAINGPKDKKKTRLRMRRPRMFGGG